MKKQTTPQSESQIQHDCLTWFRLQYPSLALLLFAVPNGGRRDAKTGARMKYEGVVRGGWPTLYSLSLKKDMLPSVLK